LYTLIQLKMIAVRPSEYAAIHRRAE